MVFHGIPRALLAAVLIAGTALVPAFSRGQKEATPADEAIKFRFLPQCDAPVDTGSPLVAYMEKQLGAKFEFMFLERAKKNELLNLRLAAGDIPDTWQAYPDDRLRDFIRQGVVRSFSEETVKQYAPTYWEQVRKYGGTSIFNYGKGDDGKLYGNPCLSFNGQYHWVPIWRDDWLKKLGFDKIPETLAEAEPVFYAFANKDPDGNGKKDTYGLSERGMMCVFGAFGGVPPYRATPNPDSIRWAMVDGKINSAITTAGSREALKLISKWYKDGLVDPEFITGENKGQYWGNAVTFWNGTIGFSQPGFWYHITSPEEDGTKTGSGNWVQFHAIQGKDASYHYGRPLIGPTGLSGTFVPGTVEGNYVVFGRQVTDKQLVKYYQMTEKLTNDPDLRTSAWYGLKGIDWEWKDQSTYTVTQLKARSGEEQARYGLGPNASISNLDYNCWDKMWIYGNVKQTPTYQSAEKMGKFPITGTPNLAWGSLPSASKYKANIEKMSVQYYTAFITGEKNVNDDKAWTDFVNAINAAGLPTLTAEAQAWYDRNK